MAELTKIDLRQWIRDIPDFPKPGILFYDITTLLRDPVGLGEALDGLDTPTLRGLWRSAPYLHDGSAPTLRSVLTERNGGDAHGVTSDLDDTDLDALVLYLRTLDDEG